MAESTVKGAISGNPGLIYNIKNGNYHEAGQDLGYGVGNVTQAALAAAPVKKCGELSNKRKGKITNQSAIIEGGSRTKDIYRAVSSEEYDDILATRGFRARPDGRSFQAKEFENSFDETLEFANKPINLDKAAIVKVTVPENVYSQLNHMNLDHAIFKSGTPVVEPEMLDMFNKSIISIEYAF